MKKEGNKNTLAVIEESALYVPGNQDFEDIYEDIGDILARSARSVFGVISIAAAGAGVFKVLEPGAEMPTNGVGEVECIIIASHPTNVLWGSEFSKREAHEHPLCRSVDGSTGVDEEGEIHNCADCPHNQFGEDGSRKECSNRRQLYILRQGDVLPMLLTLPPSALKTYDNYRVRTRMQLNRKLNTVITRITLTNKTSDKSNAEYSVPVFTPVALLKESESARLTEYAAKIMQSAQRAGVVADDLINDTDAAAPAPATNVEGCTVVDEEELPDNF
ncbi:MAG: hypothetical protein RR301_11640 [Clostridia bacterium]